MTALRWRSFVDRLLDRASSGAAVLVALVPLASLLWLVRLPGAARALAGLLHEPSHAGRRARRRRRERHRRDLLHGRPGEPHRAAGRGRGRRLPRREGGRDARGASVRFTAEVLSGVPSIVVGIVAYGLVVARMKRFSALAGGVALALLMVPSLARSTEEFIRLVPSALREASLALGRTRLEDQPAGRPPHRARGHRHRGAPRRRPGRRRDRSACSSRRSTTSTGTSTRTQPTASLTVQIYNYAISPYDDWHQKAWTAALVLLLLVGLLNLVARFLSRNRLQGAPR